MREWLESAVRVVVSCSGFKVVYFRVSGTLQNRFTPLTASGTVLAGGVVCSAHVASGLEWPYSDPRVALE